MKRTHHRRAGLLPAALLALAAGCTVGPDYVPPAPDLPDVWYQQAVEGLAQGQSTLQQWWTVFEDPQLSDLVEQAALGNLDLLQAYERVRAARALRGIAVSERFPNLDGIGAAIRDRQSQGEFPVPPPPRSRTDTTYSLGMDASWEADVFGRITRNIEAADADLEATYENYRDVLVLLLSDVATTYIDVRALQARINYAKSNVEAQRGTLQLTQDRFDAEIVPELDVRQAELNLARTEASIPELRSQLGGAIHRLGVLLGKFPGALYDDLETVTPVPNPPGAVTIGMPMDILRQRPDVRQAERDLAAQTARVGVATADLYPRFTLNGFFEYRTTGGASGSVVRGGNKAWAIGPSVRWNLFDGGQVRNNIRFEEARTEELLAAYENTVLLALEDVETSMVAYVEEKDRLADLKRSVEAASQSVELVETLYREGLTDFQNVLDMQRSLFEQQDLLAQSEGFVSQDLVSIYRALGGGWVPETEQLAGEIEDAETNGEPIF